MSTHIEASPVFITPEDTHAFLAGDCWMLAEAMWMATSDWTLVAVAVCEENPDDEGSSEVDWLHIAMRAPDGRIVDIEGVHADVEDYLQRWAVSAEMDYCEPLTYLYEVHEYGTYARMVRDQYPLHGVPTERLNSIAQELIQLVA